MKTFKNYLRLAAAIGILSFTLVLTTADLTPLLSAVPAPVAQVFVTNTATDPVPTLAQGTTTVGGTVNAAQSGPWNVDINGIPDVSIANPVILERGVPGLPLFVNDVGSPALQPFQMVQGVQINNNANFGAVDLNVPAGKRWVIEHVSVEATLPAGQKVLCTLRIFDGVNQQLQLAEHTLPLSFQGTFAQSDEYQASLPVRMYADHTDRMPGTVILRVIRDQSTGAASIGFSLSGYLVDVP